MSCFQPTLRDLIEKLTEKNYDESFTQYCFWLGIGSAHGHITSNDQVNGDISRIALPGALKNSELIHPTTHFLVRFIRDIEADQRFYRYTSRLHQERCASGLYRFFESNLSLARSSSYGNTSNAFLTDVNLIAHWANLGCVEEEIIRDRILQSLISHPKLYEHQADALIVLFKLAGATFGAYADPPVVDRCIELLRSNCRDSVKVRLTQVCARLE